MDKVGYLVADVYECAGMFRHMGEVTAAKIGQTQARWQLLSVVSDEPYTVSQAARRLGITRQSVQRVANDLIEERLIKFQPNPDHANSPLLVLTKAGRLVLKKITEGAQDYHKQLLRQIGETEFEKIHASLKTLNKELRHITAKN